MLWPRPSTPGDGVLGPRQRPQDGGGRASGQQGGSSRGQEGREGMGWQEGPGALACKWQAQAGSPPCPVLLGPDSGTRGSGQKGPAVVRKKVSRRKGVSGRPPRHSPRCELRRRPRPSPSGRCHVHGGSTAREEDARLGLMLPGGLAGSSWREGHGPRPRGVPSLLPGHTLPELRTSHSPGLVRGWSLGASLRLKAKV